VGVALPFIDWLIARRLVLVFSKEAWLLLCEGAELGVGRAWWKGTLPQREDDRAGLRVKAWASRADT
jgi:hypothetical protein